MAENFVNVTEGSGKKLHTFNKTIGANDVHDEVIIHGEPYLATYTVTPGATSAATSTSHVLQIMAGSSLNVYIRRLWIWQSGLITTAAIVPFTIQRLTTAGTGGTTVTPAALDATEAAAGCTAMTLPTVKGTESTTMTAFDVIPVQTAPTGGANTLLAYFDFSRMRGKSIRISAGTSNGIMVSNRAAAAGLTVRCVAEVNEANF